MPSKKLKKPSSSKPEPVEAPAKDEGPKISFTNWMMGGALMTSSGNTNSIRSRRRISGEEEKIYVVNHEKKKPAAIEEEKREGSVAKPKHSCHKKDQPEKKSCCACADDTKKAEKAPPKHTCYKCAAGKPHTCYKKDEKTGEKKDGKGSSIEKCKCSCHEVKKVKAIEAAKPEEKKKDGGDSGSTTAVETDKEQGKSSKNTDPPVKDKLQDVDTSVKKGEEKPKEDAVPVFTAEKEAKLKELLAAGMKDRKDISKELGGIPIKEINKRISEIGKIEREEAAAKKKKEDDGKLEKEKAAEAEKAKEKEPVTAEDGWTTIDALVPEDQSSKILGFGDLLGDESASKKDDNKDTFLGGADFWGASAFKTNDKVSDDPFATSTKTSDNDGFFMRGGNGNGEKVGDATSVKGVADETAFEKLNTGIFESSNDNSGGDGGWDFGIAMGIPGRGEEVRSTSGSGRKVSFMGSLREDLGQEKSDRLPNSGTFDWNLGNGGQKTSVASSASPVTKFSEINNSGNDNIWNPSGGGENNNNSWDTSGQANEIGEENNTSFWGTPGQINEEDKDNNNNNKVSADWAAYNYKSTSPPGAWPSSPKAAAQETFSSSSTPTITVSRPTPDRFRPSAFTSNDAQPIHLIPTDVWSASDCLVLETLALQHEEHKFLHLQAKFFNWTGRMVSAEMIKLKFRDDGFMNWGEVEDRCSNRGGNGGLRGSSGLKAGKCNGSVQGSPLGGVSATLRVKKKRGANRRKKDDVNGSQNGKKSGGNERANERANEPAWGANGADMNINSNNEASNEDTAAMGQNDTSGWGDATGTAAVGGSGDDWGAGGGETNNYNSSW